MTEARPQPRSGALAGLRGRLAPHCTRLFADFGAEVIKVEPLQGDAARRSGPYPGDLPDSEKSGLFFFHNTDKFGVTCDASQAEGRALLLELVRQADALIENNLPAQMRQWGLSHDQLAAVNPELVTISITPFGQTGPYSEWLGSDLNAYHLSGASARYCGRPGEAPLEHGTFSADYFGSVSAARGSAAASTSTCRAPRPSPRPSSAARTSACWRRTNAGIRAPAWACRWAHRPPSCPAATAMSGCWRSSPASGRGCAR